MCFKVPEFLEIRELYVADRANKLADGLVKLEDFPVEVMVNGREVTHDIISIAVKFPFPVRESEFDVSGSDSSGCNPVSMSFNHFGGLRCSEKELEFSKVLNCIVISGCGEQS